MKRVYCIKYLIIKNKELLLIFVFIITSVILYTVYSFLEYNNNQLLQRYNLLYQRVLEHSDRAKKLKLRPACTIHLDAEREYNIRGELTELLISKNIKFEINTLSEGKVLINIETANFSNLLDMLDVISYNYAVDIYQVNIYWHADRGNEDVMGRVILNITGC